MRSRSKCRRALPVLLAGFLILIGAAFTYPSAWTPDSDPSIVHLSSAGNNRIYSVAFSPDGNLLAAGSSLGIHFIDAHTLDEVRFIPTHTWVRSLVFSPDGLFLASGSYDSIVRLWRVRDGTLIRELKGHTAWVRSVAFSYDGTRLATASDDDTVRLWNVSTGDLALVLREGVTGVRAVSFSPDGKILATGGYDHKIRLWQADDGTLLHELQGHTDWVRALAFSPDGELLASGAFDATVRLWQMRDGKLLATATEHSSSVLGLAFSPDGFLLASASVDSSVRLWEIPKLAPYDLLKGHSDFVFSVAFAPDGKDLLSGSADNTLRMWEVPMIANPASTERISTPSNCKACHHPRTVTRPARVVETGCAVCHQNGSLVLNWCPALDAPVQEPTSHVVYNRQELEGGTPQSSSNFGVVITAPGNGEHLYTHPDIRTVVPIEGHVFADEIPLNEIKVRLDVWSGKNKVITLSAELGSDGTFSFPVNIRPGGGEPFPDLDGQKFYCLNCHKEGAATLSSGETLLVVSATAPDGASVSDRRIIHVDQSDSIAIPVHILLEDGQPVSGIPVQASARLYEWRGRTFTSLSNKSGEAVVEVEVLSEIPTTYQIEVPSVVLDGSLFEGLRPVEVTLAPGATTAPPVTINVRALTGELSGQLVGPSSPVDVLAIHLPEGTVFRARSSLQGTFKFPQLPVGKYLVTGNQQALVSLGLRSRAQIIDLSQQPRMSIELPIFPISGDLLTGTVAQVGGESIPFAYVTLEDNATTLPAALTSGHYQFVDAPPGMLTLRVTAPGFYSQAHVVNSRGSQPWDLALVMRPETRILPWGSGQIVVPPETRLIEDGLNLTLEHGWLWGHSGEKADSILLILESGEIEIRSGRFALEHLPGQDAWFYLIEGQAEFRAKEDAHRFALREGQMVVVTESGRPVPVPLDQAVIDALHSVNGPPLEDHWQPTLSAQIRDRLARIGISTAHVVTFITYIMAFLTLLGMPFLVLHSSIQSRKVRNDD
jgi:WD40 repeat protein